MKESDLRQWHRRSGIILALFILLQAGSGFLISLGSLSTPHSHANTEHAGPPASHEHGDSVWNKFLGFVHHGGGTVGSIYRMLVGIGAMGMALTGSAIFFKSRARFKKGTSVSAH